MSRLVHSHGVCDLVVQKRANCLAGLPIRLLLRIEHKSRHWVSPCVDFLHFFFSLPFSFFFSRHGLQCRLDKIYDLEHTFWRLFTCSLCISKPIFLSERGLTGWVSEWPVNASMQPRADSRSTLSKSTMIPKIESPLFGWGLRWRGSSFEISWRYICQKKKCLFFIVLGKHLRHWVNTSLGRGRIFRVIIQHACVVPKLPVNII